MGAGEGTVEGGLGAVSGFLGDGGEALGGGAERHAGEVEAPVADVAHRGGREHRLETLGQHAARDAGGG